MITRESSSDIEQSASDWHHLPPPEVVTRLETHPDQGLHPLAVEQRQQKYGANQLTQKAGKNPLILLLEQFNQPLIYILLVSAGITALLQDWVETWVILAVVVINALIGFAQEYKAIKAMQALAQTAQSDATVIRGGQKQQIPATELVPGDLVTLQSGNKVPADLRLLRSRDLQIDESALTGESVPVEKNTIAQLDLETALADRLNLAYASTLVTYGTATGVVIATGDRTEIGHINELISSADVLTTPLTRKINHFSQTLMYVVLGASAIAFVAGALRGYSLDDNFLGVVALAVAAIPEGLPAAVTITLAIGVNRMAKRNAIIRKLPTVETLGSTTVICSDKTGTLTQNAMTVQEIYAGDQVIRVSGVGYAPKGELSTSGENQALIECLKAGLLCNDSRIVEEDQGWTIVGDPTEAALITVAHKAGLDRHTLAQELPRHDSIPFESQYQYMATLHPVADQALIYIKGSVESLLPRCTGELSASGDTIALAVDPIHHHVEQMTTKGLRVLAFAKLDLPTVPPSLTHESLEHGLTFLGLQGMIDPPREEAVQAVQACRNAGIKVKMITGDHIGTAAAIGEQIGLAKSPPQDRTGAAMTGTEISKRSDQELPAIAEHTAVFARVTPEQKLRLVRALQSRGHVVAMTGDGVNDAPALRQADIGIAMGITGTEVAKEAASMILTDDNFATIEAAVEEGRGVYDNIIKFIVWALPTNLSEGLVIFVATLLGITLPILPLQILWINTTTAVLLGTGLAVEPKEPEIMTRSPRPPRSPLLRPSMVRFIALAGILLCIFAFVVYEVAIRNQASIESARTAAVNAIVFGQIFLLFNCRSLSYSMFQLGIFSNPILLLGVGVMIALQMLFTYAPWMNQVFGTAPVQPSEWGVILATSLGVYLLIELLKWNRRRSRA
ncbi:MULTISPECIES: cation-translocating P-type ATPase [Leptolyngbya]|uniref:cation-translocating P-type ATPase n=1 Tax=Leptolyngbya TaxID=47251 RepID=UPI001688EAE4|nr:cation-transporting P-type ATPase [Leptolyngbya sp. FACHB-1624]MBD1857531.1 cation-transporting P-type ATPase [Leptolyngbya sp. FACHB-1624]